MIVIDKPLLAEFRAKRVCEHCGRAIIGPAEPHHWKPKGMGGGSRIDARVNLASLCRRCHQMAEDGNIPRETILAIIAQREGMLQDEVQAEIWRLLGEKRSIGGEG